MRKVPTVPDVEEEVKPTLNSAGFENPRLITNPAPTVPVSAFDRGATVAKAQADYRKGQASVTPALPEPVTNDRARYGVMQRAGGKFIGVGTNSQGNAEFDSYEEARKFSQDQRAVPQTITPAVAATTTPPYQPPVATGPAPTSLPYVAPAANQHRGFSQDGSRDVVQPQYAIPAPVTPSAVQLGATATPVTSAPAKPAPAPVIPPPAPVSTAPTPIATPINGTGLATAAGLGATAFAPQIIKAGGAVARAAGTLGRAALRRFGAGAFNPAVIAQGAVAGLQYGPAIAGMRNDSAKESINEDFGGQAPNWLDLAARLKTDSQDKAANRPLSPTEKVTREADMVRKSRLSPEKKAKELLELRNKLLNLKMPAVASTELPNSLSNPTGPRRARATLSSNATQNAR